MYRQPFEDAVECRIVGIICLAGESARFLWRAAEMANNQTSVGLAQIARKSEICVGSETSRVSVSIAREDRRGIGPDERGGAGIFDSFEVVNSGDCPPSTRTPATWPRGN